MAKVSRRTRAHLEGVAMMNFGLAAAFGGPAHSDIRRGFANEVRRALKEAGYNGRAEKVARKALTAKQVLTLKEIRRMLS